MKKVYFVTTNKQKFQEVSDVLKDYPIELEHLNLEYEENHDSSMEEIAKGAAKKLAEELRKAVIVDDTGLFFEAFPGFPGALPKFVFKSLGYRGILKLIEGENRRAYFKTVVGFCEPGKEPLLFEGEMYGQITEEVYGLEKDEDAMPYNRIFIPDGETRPIVDTTLQERNKFLQRAKAFIKFGEWIKHHDRA